MSSLTSSLLHQRQPRLSLRADAGRGERSLARAASNTACNLVARNSAGVLSVPGGEGDLVSAQAAFNLVRAESAGDALVCLRQLQLTIGQPPFASDVRRHYPEMSCAVTRAAVFLADDLGFIRLPVTHFERVRDYTRAGLHRENRRPQLHVQLGQ